MSRPLPPAIPPKDQPWPDVAPERRKIMSAIRGRDTKPELRVRQLLHRLGYRFRVALRQFSSRPDVVFTGRQAAIFVHGCFWHGHEACGSWRVPRTRTEIWEAKISRNKARDSRNVDELNTHGWRVLVLWECELHDESALAERLIGFLGPTRTQTS